MKTAELESIINDLIKSKQTATPQDIAAAFLTIPRVERGEYVLERLKTVTQFGQITASADSGSVRWHDFRADWTCRFSGYGYSGQVDDIRKGLFAACGGQGAIVVNIALPVA